MSRDEPGSLAGRIRPAEFATWLDERLDGLAERWSEEILARGHLQDRESDRLTQLFVERLVSFLPWLLGPYRDQVEPLWMRCSELFGAVGAKRGLAAGEVIEEFQILRELVIRDLYQDPPVGGRLPISLRDILRLNRGIDRGVTHASVGYTDALFFQFFEREEEGPRQTDAGVSQEAETQLALLAEDLERILAHARANPVPVEG